jgi:hypothetical protein
MIHSITNNALPENGVDLIKKDAGKNHILYIKRIAQTKDNFNGQQFSDTFGIVEFIYIQA